MTTPADPVSVVEAAYDAIDAPDGVWLRAIADAASAIDAGVGVSAAFFDTTREPLFRDIVFSRSTAPDYVRATQDAIRDVPRRIQLQMCEFGAGFASQRFPELPRVPGGIEMSRAGVTEAFGVVGVDASGRGTMLSFLSSQRQSPTFAPVAAWRRVAAHLATAARLRARRTSDPREPDAVLRTDGAILHATGDARGSAQRADLAVAARGVDRARTRAARADAERALALWKALVSGRWSLVDTIESDGKRILVAYRNETPGLAAPTLTARESQVAALVAGGRSNKEIAYELGIGLSTVETLVLRARRKLGAPTRAALAACVGSRPAA